MIIDAPDSDTWSGRRDRILLASLYNTGARVSEIVNIKCADIENEQCTKSEKLKKMNPRLICPEYHLVLWAYSSENFAARLEKLGLSISEFPDIVNLIPLETLGTDPELTAMGKTF